MEVIPVIDVRGGGAVAAVRGDRANYRPLVSPLASSADPASVALGLRRLFPFETLYVADLEGIEGRGADVAMQQRLTETWPGREIWIDDGSSGEAESDAVVPPTLTLPTRGRGPVAQVALDAIPPPLWGRLGGGKSQRAPLIESQLLGPMIKSHVLGSESLTDLADYAGARETAGPNAPLSLDFRGDTFIGPRELFEEFSLWPDRVIVMTLARVGSGEGPDLTRLQSIISRAGHRKIFAAGGVRDATDLRALRDIGAAGALVATALHAGHINTRDLEEIAGE